MTFLPIVERELRVAARRPGLYRTRWFAALGTILAWLLLLCSERRTPAAELGQDLLRTLSFLSLAFCLLAGIFLTADCVSEEKREGTLGLLFLTNLRGYDIVLGKLIATSVHAVYGLLAIFPVLALPLLMGGVTAGEVWRVLAVLVVTLFLSLVMGMFVSGFTVEARQAMGGTFLGMLLPAGALPAAWYLAESLLPNAPATAWLWPSPVNALVNALDSNYRMAGGATDFWCSLQTLSTLGLGLLIFAIVVTPRSWQAKTDQASLDTAMPASKSRGRFSRLGLALNLNPYLWLAGRGRRRDLVAALLWGLVLLVWLCALVLSTVLNSGGSASESFMVCFFTAYGLHQLGKYQVAVEATRQLGEDRRSGALELLLVTPLPESAILVGQRQALWRRTRGIVGTLLFVNLCMGLLVLAASEQLQLDDDDQALFLELFVGGMVVLFFDFRAFQSVGAWMALRARTHQRAVLGTLGRIMLVPWGAAFLWVFLSVTGGISPSQGELGALFALWFVIGIVTDLIVSAQARARLDFGLRYWLAEALRFRRRESLLAPVRSGVIAQNV